MIRLALVLAALAAVACLEGCRSKRAAAAPPDALVVTYEKTGGLMPFQDSMLVRESGVVIYTDRTRRMREGFASAADIRALRSMVTSKEFLDAAPEYRNDRGADLVTHTIGVQGPVNKRVVVMDSTSHPRVLDDVIALLERMGERTR
jgi:hypothetical protein